MKTETRNHSANGESRRWVANLCLTTQSTTILIESNASRNIVKVIHSFGTTYMRCICEPNTESYAISTDLWVAKNLELRLRSETRPLRESEDYTERSGITRETTSRATLKTQNIPLQSRTDCYYSV